MKAKAFQLRTSFIGLLALLYLSINPELHAESVISITQNMPITAFTQNLTTLSDADASLSADQLLAGVAADRFQPISKDTLHHLTGAQWFQGWLENRSAESITVLVQFEKSSHVQLGIYPDAAIHRVQTFEAGWKTPFQQRSLKYLNPTFEVEVPPGKSRLLIRSEGPRFYISIGPKGAMTDLYELFEICLAFCLATYFSLGLFNFSLYLRTQDKVYFWYSMRCLSTLLVTILEFNMVAKYVLPDRPFPTTRIEVSVITLIMLSSMYLARRFLALDTLIHRTFLNIAFYGIIIGVCVAGIVPWLIPSLDPHLLLPGIGSASFFFLVGTGIYATIRRSRAAYYYMFSELVMFAGVLVMLLREEGLISMSLMSSLAAAAGGSIAVLLMSFGLGDKYMSSMKAANATLNARNEQLGQELAFMLRNLKQGIFSFGRDGKISAEYSEHLDRLFQEKDVGGHDAFALLFGGTDFSRDRIDQIRNATLAMFGESLLSYELNRHLYPREISRTLGVERQILEVDWQPLLDKDGHCDKMMVVLRDITEFKVLQEETEQRQMDLRIMGQMLGISIQTYEKFSRNAASLIEENVQIIQAARQEHPLDLPHMFRNIHTIKGNARTFNLVQIAEVAHEVEDYFSDIRLGKVGKVDLKRLSTDLQNLQNVMKKYDDLLVNFLSIALKDAPEDLVLLLNRLHQEHADPIEVREKFLQCAEEQRMKRFYPTLEEILTPVLRSHAQMANELAKPQPRVHFHCPGIQLSIEMETLLRNIFTQFLRNSIDHGIEKPEIRKRGGKDTAGTVSIEISASIHHQELIIEVSDDGAGLNLYALAQKAGNPFMSDQEAAETIFQTGVSTAEQVTHISGRGVGMDIVKDLVIKHGGSIAILFTKPRTESGRRPFKFMLRFPSHFVLQGQTIRTNLEPVQAA